MAKISHLLGCALSISLAQPVTAVAQQNAPSSGAMGRGVRIIAPEETPPPPPPPPANTPSAAKPAPVVSPTVPSVLKACVRPIADPTLRLSDGTGFDRSLRLRLRRGGLVTVDLATPYAASDPAPAPIGAWLGEIKASGGTVNTSAYCVKGRGLGGFFAQLFASKPAEPYKAARRYDATLHVDALDQTVTQVSFTPRQGRP